MLHQGATVLPQYDQEYGTASTFGSVNATGGEARRMLPKLTDEEARAEFSRSWRAHRG
jgi:hypothetical protein